MPFLNDFHAWTPYPILVPIGNLEYNLADCIVSYTYVNNTYMSISTISYCASCALTATSNNGTNYTGNWVILPWAPNGETVYFSKELNPYYFLVEN